MSVGGDTQRLLLDERLLAYFAVTRSTQYLCITRPCADDSGKELPPSPFWARIESLFPTANRTIVQKPCDEDCVGTSLQLATALMRWTRDPAAGVNDGSPWPALYQWFITQSNKVGLFQQLRERAWPALRYSNEAALSDASKSRLFASPFSGRIDRIESFAACPFKHFAEYGLGLSGRAEGDVTGMDLGRIYHAVLGNVVGDMVRRKRDWMVNSPQTAGLIRDHTRTIGQHLRDEIMLSSARNQYLLQRVENTLEQVMAAQEAATRRGMFRPAKVDVRFGEDASLSALSIDTPGGHVVNLSGKIDRIDTVSTPRSLNADSHASKIGRAMSLPCR